MLENYPDVLNLNDLCEIMNICRNTAVKLLKTNVIKYVMVGRVYRISKKSLIEYLTQ
jgi:excisionase family DNA binding protein